MPERGAMKEKEYRSRINRVLDYIETNLDRELTLDELSRAALGV